MSESHRENCGDACDATTLAVQQISSYPRRADDDCCDPTDFPRYCPLYT